MVNYQNTKIYRIPIEDGNYFGHTANTFAKRKKGHKDKFNCGINRKLYDAMRECGMTADDIELIWVEDYPCDTKYQAHARERYWIENYGTLNVVVPNRTRQEYREENKEKLVEYRQKNKDKIAERGCKYREENKVKIVEKGAKYYENNKERICEYQRKYNEANKEKVAGRKAEYYKTNKAKFAEYREVNKKEIAEKSVLYRKENKELIAEQYAKWSKQRVTCSECHCELNKSSLQRHMKAKHPVENNL
jgi:hypothetical protein